MDDATDPPAALGDRETRPQRSGGGAARFTGRAAMVTGAGHGIGRACALRLADEGARLVLLDRDEDAAAAVGRVVREAGGAAEVLGCDVTDAASVETAVAAGVAALGGLDVLVNTAGGGMHHPDFARTTDEHWTLQLELNLLGVVRVIRSAIPALLPGGGSVVTIGSVNGMVSLASEPYSAAKAGLQSLTANLATEYGPRGIRFNLVAPGTIRTRVWDDQPDSLARLSTAYPLGRIGEPADIAAAVAFLASDEAGWITGVCLPVDGGALAAGPFTHPARSG